MDASQSFQLPEKAAEANYVPAMSSLSVAYAEQKTPVCGERATYWAMKAADAGDPRGRLVLGFEYNTGNCIAMMASGELYSREWRSRRQRSGSELASEPRGSAPAYGRQA